LALRSNFHQGSGKLLSHEHEEKIDKDEVKFRYYFQWVVHLLAGLSLLTIPFQEEICYSLLDVDNLDATADIVHLSLSMT
jgi:hypothetical protein